MELSPFLSLGQGLEPTSISAAADALTVHVEPTLRSSACPLCTHLATRIHSRYTRVVADLPCAGQRVQLILHVRKFFCKTPECPRQIFTERLIPLVEPRGRMTRRLAQASPTAQTLYPLVQEFRQLLHQRQATTWTTGWRRPGPVTAKRCRALPTALRKTKRRWSPG